MLEQITLYTATVCPFAHRVEIALQEVKAEYIRFEIDLANKPNWYASRINPANKVPAIAYGGPKVPPDQPSSDSVKLAESLILVEFVADLFPESSLLPKEPVQRARARFFVDAVSTKFIPGYFNLLRGGPTDAFLKGPETIQSLLPAEGEGRFATGNSFTIADAAIAPFIARTFTFLKHNIGAYDKGIGTGLYEVLTTDPKYARLRSYFTELQGRESYTKTYIEKHIIDVWSAQYVVSCAKQQLV